MDFGKIAAAAGAAIVVGDYLNRKHGVGKDLEIVRRILPVQFDLNHAIKNNFSVAELWENTAKKYAKKTCIAFEGKEYSFTFINEQANRVAHYFASKGLKKGDVVALYMENKPEFLISWLGLSKIGVIIALINCNLLGKGLVHCIKVANSKYLIFGHESAQAIEGTLELLESEYQKIPCISYGGPVSFAEHLDPLLPNHSPENPPRSVRKGVTTGDIWAFVYTSGTTGLPKPAIIKHYRFFAGALFAKMYLVTDQDRIYTALPLYHSAGGMIGVGMMIYSGATLVLRRKFSASGFIADIQQYNCTVFQYIGELCRYLMSVPPSPNDTKHKIRIAIGNGLRPDIWEAFQKRFNIPYIGEFYAATEGNASLFNEVGLDGAGRGAIGRKGLLLRAVMPSTIVKFDVEKEIPIRGPDGFCISCPPGEAGELLGLIDDKDPLKEFAGYYGNKSNNEKKILTNVFKKGDKYFRTGDLLKMDADGYYYFVDRIGDTFRWKGENVSTNEVAEVLSVFPGIKEANVYGVAIPGADGRAGMAAVVVDPALNFATLGQHVAKELPSYAIPMFLRILPEIEITGTFKHRKVELRDQGFNPSTLQEPLYFFNPSNKTYEPFGPSQYQSVLSQYNTSPKAKL